MQPFAEYRRLLAGALLAATAACATAPAANTKPATPAAPHVTTLTNAQIGTIAELLRMEDMRVLDTMLVQRAFADPSPFVRSKAVLAAGRTGSPAAAHFLRRAASDPVDEVAADAAFAIGEFGDTTVASIDLLRTMMYRAGGGAAAREAAHAMGNLLRSAAYPSLVQALAASAPGHSTYTAAVARDVLPEILLAIWHHPRQARTVDVVLPFATATDRETRYAAVYALARAPRPAGIAALITALHDRDDVIRATAAAGLRSIVADSVNLHDAARTALLSALRDSAAHVRIAATQRLAGYRDPGVSDALKPLLDDADRNVAIAAGAALASFTTPDVAARLLDVASRTSLPIALRAQALTSAVSASNGGEDALAAARGWVRSDDWLQRLYGVRALAAAPGPRIVTDLRAAVRDRDPRVQAEVLGDIGTADTTHALDALYVESLASADPIVRSTAIAALGRHRDSNFLSALMDAYARAQTDRENDAALAAVDALGALARRDSAIARTFFLRFQRSRDPVVRTAAVRAFGSAAAPWGDPLPAATRPLAWYEDVVRRYVAPVLAGSPRPRMTIHSEGGDIVVEMASEIAPLTTENFRSLIDAGYFRSSTFRWHRVVPNFVLQDGDPRGDGSGGPGYSIRDEINSLRYTRGAAGMALSGPDTGGSQFFITHSPQPHLDGGYTVFGRVVSGMDVADRVIQDEPIHGIDISH